MTRLSLALVAILFLSGISSAEGPRLAVIDSKALFDGYKETKDAQSKYDKQVAKWEQEVADKQKELAGMKEKFEKQSLMLSDERKKELGAKFQQKQADLQKLVQSLYGKDGKVAKVNEQFTGPILQKIRNVAQLIAKSEGFDLVLDKAAGAVFYVGKPEMDITQKVLDRLNSEYTGASTPAPGATTPAAAPAATGN
ncbi:MAG: OmpH family outer membrane protein [Fibrobacteria bacterium]|nr:OmpH family outer membrane protein [Fibrobacteria bacterium]